MTFDEVLARVIDVLQCQGRVSYRALKRCFDLDAALRTAHYFQEWAARANLAVFDQLLARAGEEPPRPGDELPEA